MAQAAEQKRRTQHQKPGFQKYGQET